MLLLVFLLAVALQQGIAFLQLKQNVGSYAYANIGYGLRELGKPGDYIGQVADVCWNRMPDRMSDVEGYQPRYLIAREVAAGVTETQWFCAYLLEIKPAPPANYTPAAFPPFERKESAN